MLFADVWFTSWERFGEVALSAVVMFACGVSSLDEVEAVVLERNGRLSVTTERGEAVVAVAGSD